ncbi:unnamed protein product [Penicillium camemberti]|uniref:Str. FM013 n=1 Tax=Penicillium camemberti (strain FM 013) TaxID=1429867 RepID=A0A0G4PHZ3_PENC3|nr:unnamed protein product [Penicillium camemberti]
MSSDRLNRPKPVTYPDPDRTGGPMDLIHVATIKRGQNKVPCRFVMNTNPTAYALVYRTKEKKDLSYCRLQDLQGFSERVCDETHDFPSLAFTATRPYDASYLDILLVIERNTTRPMVKRTPESAPTF